MKLKVPPVWSVAIILSGLLIIILFVLSSCPLLPPLKTIIGLSLRQSKDGRGSEGRWIRGPNELFQDFFLASSFIEEINSIEDASSEDTSSTINHPDRSSPPMADNPGPNFVWVKCSAGKCPKVWSKSEPVMDPSGNFGVCRAKRVYTLFPGQFSDNECSVAFYESRMTDDFEILTAPKEAYRWVSTAVRVDDLANALPGGIYAVDKSIVYIGLCHYQDGKRKVRVPGYIPQEVGRCVFSYHGVDHVKVRYDVLLANDPQDVTTAEKELLSTDTTMF